MMPQAERGGEDKQNKTNKGKKEGQKYTLPLEEGKTGHSRTATFNLSRLGLGGRGREESNGDGDDS